MEPRRISASVAKRRLDRGERVTFVDARSDHAWHSADRRLPHSVRVPPDDAEAYLDEVPRNGLIVPYCT